MKTGTGTAETNSTDPNALAVVVQGDEMFPAFQHGDRVILEPSRKPKPGDAVLVRLKKGGTLFRWYGEHEGKVVLMRETTIEAETYSRDEIKFIYPALEFLRTIKRAPFITFTPTGDTREQIRAAATALGMSENDILVECLKRGLDRAKAKAKVKK